MLDHVSITVTNIGAAEKFYDAVMSALGVPKVRKSEIHVPSARERKDWCSAIVVNAKNW
jgi:catechol 2,3-dioxygenase-like lactoylglutathione lyase family enzyme